MIYTRDLKKPLTREIPIRRTPRKHSIWPLYIVSLVIGISLLGVVLAKTHDSLSRTSIKAPIITEIPPPDPAVHHSELEAQTASDWIEHTVKSGDSASAIFDQYQIHSSLLKINNIPVSKKVLQNLYPGQKISLKLDWKGLEELYYQISETKRLHVTRDAEEYSANIIQDAIETRRLAATGTIDNSLFLAGKKAGISDSLIMQMVEIFSYDIDFALDIRQGDQFEIIYDEYFANGAPLKKSGSILAARFTTKNKTFTALKYEHNNKIGYFDAKGRSNKKAFIRTPVRFSRISSHFNPKRKHPILHTIRAHKGVDYAAPKGTTVKSTGSGKIQFIGRKGGYGKVIIVKHAGGYSTLYAHLSKFKKGLKRGKSVKQGQAIGYVGSTGSATGPHLHYEFRVNGKHKNPLTVKLPNASPLRNQQLREFKEKIRPLLVQLSQPSLAAN